MRIKRYEAKDEDELLELIIDDDPDKFKGWEGPIEAHLRSVRYSTKKFSDKAHAVNK